MLDNIISTTVFRNQSKDGLMIKTLNGKLDDLIHAFAKYDHLSESYELQYHQLEDFHQQELASIVMASSEGYSSEATSFDNPDYEKKMLPSLIAYMANPFDRDLEIEFKEKWREGVANYFTNYISEALSERLQEYNTDMLGRTAWAG